MSNDLQEGDDKEARNRDRERPRQPRLQHAGGLQGGACFDALGAIEPHIAVNLSQAVPEGKRRLARRLRFLASHSAASNSLAVRSDTAASRCKIARCAFPRRPPVRCVERHLERSKSRAFAVGSTCKGADDLPQERS
jgi:hypothetical protein